MDEAPEGCFICYDCTAGKSVLFGDVVWVKIGNYRWWPARVVPLEEFPIQYQDRQLEVGEFLVQFYGSHDFAFVHRGQAFHYQEGVRNIYLQSTRKCFYNRNLIFEIM